MNRPTTPERMAREPFVMEAVGARLRQVSSTQHNVEFLAADGSVRAVRPASVLEVHMWNLLCTKEKDWVSAHTPHPSTFGRL